MKLGFFQWSPGDSESCVKKVNKKYFDCKHFMFGNLENYFERQKLASVNSNSLYKSLPPTSKFFHGLDFWGERYNNIFLPFLVFLFHSWFHESHSSLGHKTNNKSSRHLNKEKGYISPWTMNRYFYDLFRHLFLIV